MPNYPLSSVSGQVDTIRIGIRIEGVFVAGCKELSVLCPGVSGEKRLLELTQIAGWEGWAFDLLPDDKVRFTSLNP